MYVCEGGMSASGEDTWTTFLLLDPSIATEHSPVVGVSHEIDEPKRFDYVKYLSSSRFN